MVGNVLNVMTSTLDVCHFETSPWNTLAPAKPNPRSVDTTDNFTIGGVFIQEPYKVERTRRQKTDSIVLVCVQNKIETINKRKEQQVFKG